MIRSGNKLQPAPKPSSAKVISDNWYVVALVAVAFLINAHTLTYDYAYDDVVFTSRNTLIDTKGIAAIPELFTHGKNYSFQGRNYGSYRPLLPVSFALEKGLFGFNPAVSHLINLLMFCLLIVLLFKLLRKTFQGYSRYLIFFVLLLYELHPVHTEVIANVKSRDEIMAFIFASLCMLQSVEYVAKRKVKNLVLTGIYLLLALLSKESAISFLCIVPVTLYFFTPAKSRTIVISTIPCLVSAILFVVLQYYFLDPAPKTSVLENALMGATGLSEKLGTIMWIQLRYIILLVFPYNLRSDYSFNEIPLIAITDYRALLSLALLTALLVYAVVNTRRKNIIAYCILFYFSSVCVTSNLFIEIGATMAERFLFVPSIAYCTAVAFLLAKLFKANTATLSYRTAPKFTWVILGISVLYSLKTVARNEDWKDNFTLFKNAVELSPGSWRTQNCMGTTYKEMAYAATDPELRKQYIAEAIGFYKEAILIYPDYDVTQANIGAAYYIAGDIDSAIVHLNRSIELGSESEIPYVNLGNVYLNLNKFDVAILNYKKALSIKPNDIMSLFYMGIAYVDLKKYDSAVINFKKTIEIAPEYNDHKAIEYVSIVYRTMGLMDSALKYKAMANQYNPSFSP